MKVKICGITRAHDARVVETAGADAIGLIFAVGSKRRVTLEDAQAISASIGPLTARIGVFRNQPLDEVLSYAATLKLSAVQLHGDEDAAFIQAVRDHHRVIKAVNIDAKIDLTQLSKIRADALLLDSSQPGSGHTFNWSLIRPHLPHLSHLILSGGLTSANVTQGIQLLKPYAVDVASGVESSKGIKDPTKVLDFVRKAKTTPLHL